MRTTTIPGLIAAVMISIFAAQVASAGQMNKDTNQAVRTVIMDRIQKHGLLNGNDINVTVEDSVITLSGTVKTLQTKEKAERDANAVGNNFRVVDDLAVIPVKMADRDMYAKIAGQIQNNAFYSIFDWVTLDVQNGNVTLAGWVYEPWHKRQFEHLIERVPGVLSVDNQIKIESGSIYDDGIRYRAASLIYDDPFFDDNLQVLDEPIHIIVNNGDVTLEGTVSTAFQKNWAKNAIYSNTNAFNVYNDLKIG